MPHPLLIPNAEFTSALCHEEWHVADGRLTIKTSAAASPGGMHAAASTASLASLATVSSVASLASLGGSGACWWRGWCADYNLAVPRSYRRKCAGLGA